MIFENMPPEPELVRPLPIVRPKPDKPMHTVLLAEHWVGLYTHWFGEKTIACGGDECKACERNVPRIWKGFIPVCDAYNPDTKVLLQFTPRCVAILLDYESVEHGFFGARVIWSRIGNRKNAPLSCAFVGWTKAIKRYSEFDLQDIVSSIFRDKVQNDKLRRA
jgi:hypothetical protein